MALWEKVKTLDPTLTKKIVELYSTHNIPIEARDIFSTWIEASVLKSEPQQFCSALQLKLEQLLLSQNNDLNIPFYIRGKLLEFQNYLKGCNHLALHTIHKSFQVCLENERVILNGNTLKINENILHDSATPSPSSSTTSSQSQNETQYLPISPSNASIPQADEYSPNASSNDVDLDFLDDFVNNPCRVVIDREMGSIAGAVRVLENSNSNNNIKCLEFKRLQEQRTVLNGTLNSHHAHELETQMYETKAEIHQMINQISTKITEIGNHTVTVMQNLSQLKTELQNNVTSWTYQQKLHANGMPITTSLNSLRRLSKYVMEVAWDLRHHLLTTFKVYNEQHISIKRTLLNSNISTQLSSITELIKSVVQDTFLVTHQPCQVVKTNVKFHVPGGSKPMTVELLVGDKLSLQVTPPTVSVCLVDEFVCREIQGKGLNRDNFDAVAERCRLLPGTVKLNYSKGKRCSARFNQISLNDFQRSAARKGKEQESVTEEKFALLFRSSFVVGDISFKVWRLSLPVVVCTHGSQKSLAWAAISWDNAFSQMGRIPFQLPDYVTWEGVCEMMNGRFSAMVGAPLTSENLSYFSQRLSTFPGFPNKLTWTELCKSNLPGKKFTFWDWFYEGASLIEQHFQVAWKEGFVKGFIGKESSETMLCSSGSLPGTFLLRFSESTLGGISIVWLHSDGSAYSLAPFKSKDLAKQPLAEILDQETLHFVYPNVNKEDAFKSHYNERTSSPQISAESGPDNTRRYELFVKKFVLANPNIPRFRLIESSSGERGDNSQSGSSQEQNSENSSPNGDNVIYIDELIQRYLESMDYSSSPGNRDTSSATSNLPVVGARTTEFERFSPDNSEQTFYMEL